ncbi:hypothetical protein D9758_003364 [Tetrapyrgos nigripes]|uniref:F-box domain-containing protein n=1 Tax=Tetrapyrgos nigripes TaxID=182062 RepID=A0A8H5GV09_9AGAR|nr:hypothetical protein D9758_003364 [Tetrapyrgos nigripes]
MKSITRSMKAGCMEFGGADYLLTDCTVQAEGHRLAKDALYGYKDDQDNYSNADDYEEKDASSSSSKPRGRKRAATKKDVNPGPRKNAKSTKKQRLDLGKFFDSLPTELQWRARLLSLSHTNKEFRKLLQDTPDSIWKVIRENTGLPELEAKDITERQYITLVFNKDCHSCGQKSVQGINYMNCARLCPSCKNGLKFGRKTQLQEYLRTLHPKALECAKDSAVKDGYITPRGIEKLSKKLCQLSEAELEAFVKQRRTLKEQIARDAQLIETWHREGSARRSQTDRDKREARQAAIKEKLIELGWREDDLLSLFWEEAPGVDRTGKLTEATWNKIRDPMLIFLRGMLIDQRNRERQDAINSRYLDLLKAHPNPDLFPSRQTFLDLPTVKSLWNKNEHERGTDPGPVECDPFVPFDETEWNANYDTVKENIASYETEMQRLAKERLAKAYVEQGLEVPADPIHDPRSMFRYTPPVLTLHSLGTLPPENDYVLPFPAIHRRMRDRQDETVVFLMLTWNVKGAAEFSTGKSHHHLFQGTPGNLSVDLGAELTEGGTQ